MKEPPLPWDDRRILHISTTADTLVDDVADALIQLAKKSIDAKGSFSIALSGGSTPIKLYQALASPKYKQAIDWSKVWLFWGDERCVPPESEESNYGAAMRAGLQHLDIPANQIFRMVAEEHVETHAADYEHVLQKQLPGGKFDLLLLGVGPDGHTASLFPESKALHEAQRLCVANWVPSKECWRMTLTYPGLKLAKNTWFLASGEAKAEIVSDVLTDIMEFYPAAKVGSNTSPAMWMIDYAAASQLPIRLDQAQ